MEQDDPGTIQATYTYGPGIDNILSMRRGGESYYYIKDGLGSVTALVDSSGFVVESYSYDAYGRPQFFDSNNVLIAGSQVGNPYLFTGRRYNTETGLCFYRARYYDPVVGRFISKDPIDLLGGLNLYTYVTNNPINSVDPFGLKLFEIQEFKGGSGALVFGLGGGGLQIKDLETGDVAVYYYGNFGIGLGAQASWSKEGGEIVDLPIKDVRDLAGAYIGQGAVIARRVSKII